MDSGNENELSRWKRTEHIGKALLNCQLVVSHLLWPIRNGLEKAPDNQLSFTRKWTSRLRDRIERGNGGESDGAKTCPLVLNTWRKFERFCTLWLTFLLLRSVFYELYLILLEWINFTSLPSHCLDVSKIIIYRPGDRLFTIMIGFIILGWRCYQRLYNSYSLTMIHHLLEDENRISEFIDRYFEFSKHESVRTMSIVSNKLPAHDKLLRNSLCYRGINEDASSGNEKNWRLRPNRTLEARKNFIFIVVKSTCIAGVSFVAIIMIPIGLWFYSPIFSDYEYVISYPNCDKELDELFHENKLPWISVTAHPHRLISLVFDLTATFVCWFTSWTMIFSATHLSFLLEYDLLAYWKEVDKKIVMNLDIAQKMHDNYVFDYDCQPKVFHYSRSPGSQKVNLIHPSFRQAQNHNHELAYAHSTPRRCFRRPQSAGKYGNNFHADIPDNVPTTQAKEFQRGFEAQDVEGLDVETELVNPRFASSIVLPPARSLKQSQIDVLEEGVADLHAQIFDFFTQVELVDAAVSDILTVAVATWLGTSTTFSFYFILLRDSDAPLILEFGQMIAFLIISSLVLSLLSMHRACMKSYVMFCSLMAHDQTTRKLDYTKLMAFFSGDRRRTSFTLFRSILFTPNTYVTMIGWSVSCYFIAFTLLGKQIQQGVRS